jgi:hypothetical protein
MQTKKHSFIEASTASTLKVPIIAIVQIGYLKWIWPLIVFYFSEWTATIGALLFSVIAWLLSIGMGYIIRRYFNKLV